MTFFLRERIVRAFDRRPIKLRDIKLRPQERNDGRIKKKEK